MMDLTFNVIFTPGTVRYLKLAAMSLVKYSPYRYRLVANALDAKESAELKAFCDASDRLEFYAYRSPYKPSTVVPHGEVLTTLERENASDFFCFMDSDIFAVGRFHEELERELASCDVFSSCRQIMVEPGEVLRGYNGRCIETPEGIPLATTFFAVYRSAPLRKVIRSTGVSFERAVRPEMIPEPALDVLKGLGVARLRFDTGKLLNVVSRGFGVRYRYMEMENLLHLGGVSAAFGLANETRWLAYGLKRILGAAGVVKYKRAAARISRKTEKRRLRAGFFFADYLRWLNGERPEPRWVALNDMDEIMGRRINTLCGVVSDIHASFDRDKSRLASAALKR
jgi:hypothetical protein